MNFEGARKADEVGKDVF